MRLSGRGALSIHDDTRVSLREDDDETRETRVVCWFVLGSIRVHSGALACWVPVLLNNKRLGAFPKQIQK